MLETLGEFTLANSTRYVPALITLVALSALAISHTMTPFLSAASYLAPPVVTAFWIGWKLRRSFTLRIFDMRPGLRVLSSYGLRSYGVDILATLSTQIDQVLVIGILSATNMGVYVVALNTSRVLQLLHQAVVTVVLPSAAGLEKERVVAMVGRATRVSTLIGAVFAVVLIALFPLLIPLFYGSEFGVAVRVAQVLTIEALLGGLIFVLAQTFMALGRPGLVTALQGFGLVVAVPCMFLLMPRLGLMGAALALLISTGCRLIFLFVCFPLVLHVPVPSIVPVGADFASLRRGLKSQA
jgi:O-antigen/teichoic acid export membrane protein